MIRVISIYVSFLIALLFVGAAFAQSAPADLTGAMSQSGSLEQSGLQAALQSAPPQLKAQATVVDDVIRVGDLWDNTGAKAQTPVARAPQPGHHLTLDARWLASMATTVGIDWRPASNYDRLVVDRAGQSVDISAVETELREALSMEGLPKDAEFEISNRSSMSIVIPTDVQPTLAIKDVMIDSRTQRFSAMLEVPAGSPQAVHVKIMGRTFMTTRIPTLARAMGRGETITSRDIVWVGVRDDSMRQDCVTDAQQILGMEPKALLKAGVPIRMAELEKPVLVGRNTLVTMILQTPLMTLTSQGRVSEDGSLGDLVKVTNLQTKQVVEARVQSNGTVLVAAVPAARPIASAY